MLRIKSVWTQGLNPAEKKEMEELVRSSTNLLDRLDKILYNMQESKETTVLADYDSPSWSHKQAHQNGQLDIIRQLRSLLKISERDDHPTI